MPGSEQGFLQDRERVTRGGAFSPDTLPASQFQIDESEVLDRRINQMLRPPSEREARQMGDAYRSDLWPHNYRTATFFIPDVPLTVLNQRAYVEFQCDFPIWAFQLNSVDVLNDANTLVSTSHEFYCEATRKIDPGGLFNLPSPLNGIWRGFWYEPGGAITPGLAGAGKILACFDRWVPLSN